MVIGVVARVIRSLKNVSAREQLDNRLSKFGFRRARIQSASESNFLIHAFLSPFEEVPVGGVQLERVYVSERPFMVEYLLIVSNRDGRATDLSRTIYGVQLPIVLDSFEFGPACLGVTDVGTRGANAVRFESDPFNQNFAVSGSNREFVFAIVHERMMEFFESELIHQWAFSGPFGRCEIRDFTEVANCRKFSEQFWDLIPEYVKEERKAPRPALSIEVEPDLIRYKR